MRRLRARGWPPRKIPSPIRPPARKNKLPLPVHSLIRKVTRLSQPRRRVCAAVLAAMALCRLAAPVCPAAAPSSLLRLPRFDGEAGGNFQMPQSGLEFRWRVTAESPPDEPRVRRGRLEIDGHGAHLVARATLDLASGVTQWEIETATADLAGVFPVLAPRHLPDYAHLFVTGTITAKGAGTLTAAGGFSGAATVEIDGASVRDFFGGWSAEGLSLRVGLPSLPSLETAPAQRLALGVFSRPAANIDVRDAAAEITFDGGSRIHFSNTKVAGYGGSVAVSPFTLDLGAPSVSARVRVENIDSASLAAFLPGGIAEAHGRFSGELDLAWSPQTGVVPGVGKLELVKAPGAAIRLSKAPGFFTANMLPRLYLLPDSLGFLQRWLSIKNPAYDVLQKIERGEVPIAVDAITINFTPDGDEQGRSASVVIAARPVDPKSAVKNLRINVNVTGPVTKVLEIGATDRVQIGF